MILHAKNCLVIKQFYRLRLLRDCLASLFGHIISLQVSTPGWLTFTITTLLISIPVGELLFVMIATLYGGSMFIRLLFALSFMASFLLGGVTGIFLGASAVTFICHTYFVIAHFHCTFILIVVIAVFVDLSLVSKCLMPYERNFGQNHFWGTAIPFNFIFLPLFALGLLGQNRRIYDFQISRFSALSIFTYYRYGFRLICFCFNFL